MRAMQTEMAAPRPSLYPDAGHEWSL